ncbi:signal peptidase II [Patescibacteria group bacterium]|nr:signal peptidase II [Patescibacteria group bacterium]
MFRTTLTKALLFLGIFGGIVVVDQILKSWIVRNVVPGEMIGNDWLNLSFHQNEGIAFGIPFAEQYLYVLIAVVLVILFVFYRKSFTRNYIVISMAVVSGGALSNLSDRIFRGAVVDYIGVFYWPFFNLADVAITAGVLMLAIDEIWGKGKKKT